jgi:hypothetical protein
LQETEPLTLVLEGFADQLERKHPGAKQQVKLARQWFKSAEKDDWLLNVGGHLDWIAQRLFPPTGNFPDRKALLESKRRSNSPAHAEWQDCIAAVQTSRLWKDMRDVKEKKEVITEAERALAWHRATVNDATFRNQVRAHLEWSVVKELAYSADCIDTNYKPLMPSLIANIDVSYYSV